MGCLCFPHLPERLSVLEKLAYNLWWTWNPIGRELWRALDLAAYRATNHNPVKMLSLASPEGLERAARDPEFLRLLDRVAAEFDRYLSASPHPALAGRADETHPIVYFSAEFGIHASLPTYAGGLGILAGDTLKEASDQGLPLVGLGLIYSHGYVAQRLRPDGWQEEAHETLNPGDCPLAAAMDEQGQPLLISVPGFDPPVYVEVWKAQVGRVPLYLLSTEVEKNAPWDRTISQRLYTSDLEQRLRQEIVLGIGGMRALAALGLEPRVVHLNEGHPAFAALEGLRRELARGQSWEQALEKVRGRTVFTTHTPLLAGTDVFPFPLVERYLGRYCEEGGIDRRKLFQLGTDPRHPEAGFNMTVFALRMSKFCNAVSHKHAEVARRMWAGVAVDHKEADIHPITNGVHLPTWIEPLRVQALFDRYLGKVWRERPQDPAVWEAVDQIPDEELWQVHQERKVALFAEIVARARRRWQGGQADPGLILASGVLLDPRHLTLGFARRFTAYKRPTLLLYDLDRLERILNHPLFPVQIVFAGKAHPADHEGKRLLQEVVRVARDPRFAGRIAFVEGYDEHLAKYLVAGVDVWVNTPQPPLEASGTSGIKASVNGVPHLSVLDGWWPEGYSGDNGWAVGPREASENRTPLDAESLYTLLEDTIVPMYYERGPDGVPHRFVQVMKRAIKTVAPRFSARRMLRNYTELFYLPALP